MNRHCNQRQKGAERGEPSDCKTFAEVTAAERRKEIATKAAKASAKVRTEKAKKRKKEKP